MEPRDVIPPVDVANEQRELVAGPGPTIEPRWLDIDTAAQYLCMTRHALYHQVARLQLPFIRHGRLLRLDRVALDRWLEKERKYGFGEARRRLVPTQDDQRPGVSRVHRVRGQEGRRAARQRDRARHPRGRARLEE
ncbi:MAG: helix-turn-helix domain-containing protein, partial [bacterium]